MDVIRVNPRLDNVGAGAVGSAEELEGILTSGAFQFARALEARLALRAAAGYHHFSPLGEDFRAEIEGVDDDAYGLVQPDFFGRK